MKTLWVLCTCILFLTIFSSSSAQLDLGETDIEGIRLENGFNEYSGRVEILYNGTWGTICDRYWSSNDLQVTCRMLGLSPLCALYNARFGAAKSGVPIWMDRLLCNGRETALDQCSFSGWGENYCSHRDDSSAICYDENDVDVPTNIELVNSTTTSLVIRFSKSENVSTGLLITRYRIRYTSDEFTYARTRTLSVSPSNRDTELTYVLTGLTRNTQYTVDVRFEGRSSYCYTYMYGNYSAPVTLITNNTVPPSNIPVRLVPPETGLDFMGRVEVFHNNEWGTVCDDLFGIQEGNVICGMLNYTRAICTASRARLGRGTGRIWLDDVSCSSAEILDQCSFRPWGEHNCLHSSDVGVICLPDSYPPKIANLTITGVSTTSVSLSWEPFDFPSTAITTRYLISYIREGLTYPSSIYISSTSSSYRLQRLQFLATYNFTVRAQVRFSSCYTTISGVPSDTVTATLMETPPSTAPTSFHVTVLNCTSIRPEWELPALSTRNGIIRGFRVYIQPSLGGQEMEFNITNNQTTEVIINDLTPDTQYVVSVLAYTVGDGPRSIHLTVATTPENICHVELINLFGLFGNGLNRGVLYTYSTTNIHILCGTSVEGVQLDWYFSNGTKVGTTNRNVREGHFANGTASLQIASDRRLSSCDGGVYKCRANLSESNQAQEQTYTLIINSSPPSPSNPTLLKVTDTAVTFSWQGHECYGGHVVESFNIRYSVPSFFYRRYQYIRGIDRDQRNYTITGLTPNSDYDVSVQVSTTDTASSSYSSSTSFTTLIEAPSPPEGVSVVLVTPVTLQVSWRSLSVSSGAVTFYTVYAFPFVTTVSDSPSRSRRQVDENSLGILAKNFSAAATSGNITVHDQSITYNVQVSATILSSTGIFTETNLSPISTQSTIFVPLPGLPVPVNVEVVRTLNSSVTLRWNYPPPPSDKISEFQVLYSGMVDGVSPAKTLVMFTHEGTISTTNTEVTIAPLTPATSYIFEVSALSSRGKGQDVLIEAQTESAESDLERYVYFNLQFGPVLSCVDFRSRDIEMKGELIREQLTDALRRLCNCDISPVNIQNDAFGCGQLDHSITYRGRMLGTSDYSGIGLVELLQSWIETNEAFITIDTFRMQVDATCTARLDTIDSPDCPLGEGPNPISTPTVNSNPSTVTTETDGTEPAVVTLSAVGAHVSAGEVGGFIMGSLALLVLLVLLVIILVVVLRRKQTFIKHRTLDESSMVVNDDKRPFADMEPSTHESSLFEEKMKD